MFSLAKNTPPVCRLEIRLHVKLFSDFKEGKHVSQKADVCHSILMWGCPVLV